MAGPVARPDRTAQADRRAARLRHPHRGGVRSSEGADPRRLTSRPSTQFRTERERWRDQRVPDDPNRKATPHGTGADDRSERASDPAASPPGSRHLRREGSGHDVPADRRAAPAGQRSQRADRDARRRGLRVVERVRRSVQHADRGAARRARAEVQPVSHDGAVLTDAPGVADGSESPLRGNGRDHRDRDVGAGLQLGAADGRGAARADDAAQRLQHGAVRQMSRGAGVADEPDGPVRSVAHRRRRLRVLLRLPRRRDEPVVPRAL